MGALASSGSKSSKKAATEPAAANNKVGTKRKAPTAMDNGESFHPPSFSWVD